MSDMIIRQAVEADVSALSRMLAALTDEIGDPSPVADDAASLARHGFGPRPLFEALIAEAGGEPMGLALYFPEFSTFRRRPGVYLQDLYVAPAARGTGLGRRLIGAVLRAATAWDAGYLKLAVHHENQAAIGFYQQLGFQTDTQVGGYWVDGPALQHLAETP